MSRRRGTAPVMLPLVLLAWTGQAAEPVPAAQVWDPGREWTVDEGFALAADAEGFELPTAMAFVPPPGPDLQDPLSAPTRPIRDRSRSPSIAPSTGCGAGSRPA